jgi:hypothetical protein
MHKGELLVKKYPDSHKRTCVSLLRALEACSCCSLIARSLFDLNCRPRVAVVILVHHEVVWQDVTLKHIRLHV